jgi:hypothetical protein
LLLSLSSLCACGAELGASEEEPGRVSQPFTQVLDDNGLVPIHGAKVAVTGTHAHIFTAFTVKDAPGANGKIQIAGRGFTPEGTPFGTFIDDPPTHPKLHAYSSGPNEKSSPSVAWDVDGSPEFLVVWQDQYSSTDHDIWGAFVTDDGRPYGDAGAFHINFDSADERAPSVIKVRENGSKWLVIYTRKNGNTTSLSGNWVHRDGTVEPLIDVVPSGVDAGATPPSASYISQFGNILFTWNNNQLAFGDYINLGLGTVLTVSNATGITSAANTNNGLAAITWRDANSIKARTFPGGCALLLCATPTRTLITNSGGIQNPVIAGNGFGFGVFAGTLPASNKTIAMKMMLSDGTVGAGSGAVNPVCGGPVPAGGALGAPGTIAAATWPDTPAAREYLIYAGLCDQSPLNSKVQVAAPSWNPGDVLAFNATN